MNLEWRGSSKIGTPYCRSHVNSTPVLVYSIFLLYPLTNIFQSTVIQGTRALRNDLNVVSCGILKVHSEFVLTNYLLFIRCIIDTKVILFSFSNANVCLIVEQKHHEVEVFFPISEE